MFSFKTKIHLLPNGEFNTKKSVIIKTKHFYYFCIVDIGNVIIINFFDPFYLTAQKIFDHYHDCRDERCSNYYFCNVVFLSRYIYALYNLKQFTVFKILMNTNIHV